MCISYNNAVYTSCIHYISHTSAATLCMYERTITIKQHCDSSVPAVCVCRGQTSYMYFHTYTSIRISSM